MNQSFAIDVSGVMPRARATGLFVSLCTIQEPSTTLHGGGTPVNTYANVTGLVDLPCMKAPPAIDKAIGATESRTMPDIRTDNFWHVLLDRFYPTLTAGWRRGWRAVIDGVQYNISGVDGDSQSQMTRLAVERVTV